MAKIAVKFGTATNTAGETISESGGSNSSVDWSAAKQSYNRMNVIINVKTLTGTSVTFSIQERFSDIGFVETGNSGAITATGKYILSNDGQTGQTNESKITYGHYMLGSGLDKQVVTTTSALTALNADIYLGFITQ